MMDFKQFSERINLMEYLSSLSDEELDRFIAFADGADAADADTAAAADAADVLGRVRTNLLDLK